MIYSRQQQLYSSCCGITVMGFFNLLLIFDNSASQYVLHLTITAFWDAVSKRLQGAISQKS
jgi:hypothetical protein